MPWRTIRRCVLCTILGLVTSVVVAWGAAVHAKLRPQGMSRSRSGPSMRTGAPTFIA